MSNFTEIKRYSYEVVEVDVFNTRYNAYRVVSSHSKLCDAEVVLTALQKVNYQGKYIYYIMLIPVWGRPEPEMPIDGDPF